MGRHMGKAIMMKSSLVLLVLAIAELFFTFIYFHYAKDNCLLGREYSKKPRKPVVSLLFGVLGADLMAASIVFFVLGLVWK